MNVVKNNICTIIKIIIIINFNMNNIYAMNKIVTLSSANEVLSHINNLSAEPTVFIDVDDTIITPKSYSFRSPPYNKLIDKIKANHDKYDNYEEIISNWRLQRKIILIDEQWSDVINKLKEKYKVFALTAMDMGPIGNIASMEQWRYNELSSYGINFTQNISFKNQDKANECFYKGIFMTGTKSKSKTIEPFLSELSTKTLVMVDDRMSHIDD